MSKKLVRQKRVIWSRTLGAIPEGRMRVVGKQRTFMVPQHLDGVYVASNARRIVAYLIEIGISGGILLLTMLVFTRSFLGAMMWMTDGELSESMNELLVPSLCWVSVAVLNLVLLAVRGQSIGRWLARTRVVRYADGRQAGVRALAKALLSGVIVGLPLSAGVLIDVCLTLYVLDSRPMFPTTTFAGGLIGLAVFAWVALKTQDMTNRHWIDQICGVITIDVREGSDSAKREAPGEMTEAVDGRPGAAEDETPLNGTELSASPDTQSGESQPADEMETRTAGENPITLMLDDGTSHVLERPVVVGRDPSCDDAHQGAVKLPVADTSLSVSKTHMALSLKAGAVLVEDLHSTNGTYVRTADGGIFSVVPGRCLIVGSGSTIHFGDRILQVEE
ncbi:MAG: RDD family protein [Ancrocorticia sp.]